MNIDEITRIAELMTDHDLTEFVIESPEIKLSIKRNRDDVPGQVQVVTAPVAVAAPAPAAASAAAPAPAAAAPAAAPAAPAAKAVTIDSPIVGTFYSAPSPEAPAFVKVGAKIQEDTVICIVEAMKVMNEIKAEKRGTIKKVLVQNAQPVEFGQPLFEIEEEK